ncbi:hypothetical protein [Pleomorphochaeta sp. DL1XJH-081]|uniref:hypothetical protein n=1 Tax=Pleomorphochaeta sp. DL1XJH-081 TaxID=3409690 RepID=UPI003BB72D81
MKIQNKELHGYFQSDDSLINYQFTDLRPGDTQLIISAPNYETITIPLKLERGVNRIEKPISLKGLTIPGLDGFYVFENEEADGWSLTIRPVTEDNRAISLHPTIDIWIGAKISKWDPLLARTIGNLDKQPILYSGNIPWKWDAYPETQFRYTSFIPFDVLPEDSGKTYVIEYLILVPNLLEIDYEEFHALTKEIPSMDTSTAKSYLESLGTRVSYYADISWDVTRSQ